MKIMIDWLNMAVKRKTWELISGFLSNVTWHGTVWKEGDYRRNNQVTLYVNRCMFFEYQLYYRTFVFLLIIVAFDIVNNTQIECDALYLGVLGKSIFVNLNMTTVLW